MDRTSILLIFALFFAVARSGLSWPSTSWGDDAVEEMDAEEEEEAGHMTEEEIHDVMKHAFIERLEADDAIVHSHDAIDKMLAFMKNQEDHLVDTCTENSKAIELTFQDEERTFPLCYMPYTVGPLHLTVHDGDTISCSDQRVAPSIQIKEHGDLVTDGLYALVIVDRDLEGYDIYGTLDQPYLHLMVLNIHGSDVENGYMVREWEASTFSNHMQVFLYRQKDYIYRDFALAKYMINGNGCDAMNRCNFFQREFVMDNDMVLESTSSFIVNADPWSSWFLQITGLMTGLEGCIGHVSYVADHVLMHHEVDTTDIDEVLKFWEKYTQDYMGESCFEEHESLFEYQRAYLRGYYSEDEEDAVIPYHTVLTHTVGFWFKSKPESIGPMCGVKFHLPGVDRKCFLDGQEISAAEQRHMPMIKIINLETHHEDSEHYFTLILADRTDGFYSLDAQTKDEPYLLWFVMNIKNSDLEHANHLVKYLPGYDSTANVVLLYKQYDGYIHEFPIFSYTGSSCASEARCRFELKRFVERYNVELVGVSKYTITGDVYSAMELIRRGMGTPDDSCASYLSTIEHSKTD